MKRRILPLLVLCTSLLVGCGAQSEHQENISTDVKETIASDEIETEKEAVSQN